MRFKMGFFLVLCIGLALALQMSDTRTPKQITDKHVPNDWFFRQRAWPQGLINTDVWRAAQTQAATLKAKAVSRRGNEPVWQFAGPLNIGGRITDIVMDPNGFSTIYAGSASGGLFKSTDTGNTWTSSFDTEASLSVGTIAMHPNDSDTLYVGTGEVNGGGGSLTYGGKGIYRTTDAGTSWTHLGLDETHFISRIRINRQNPQVLFVGGMGKLYGADENRGVYRSTNGGTTWEQVLFVSDTTGCIDLAIHPTQPEWVYAAMWQRQRSATERNYGGPDCGLYRSSDGGDSWQEMTTGLPNNSPNIGRIGISLSASNPNVLYAIYADNIGFFNGIYKTENGGDSWTQTNDGSLSNLYSSFGWWFGNIRIDPNDPDVVYAMGLEIYKSTNAGNSWFNASSGIHVDQHALYIHPDDSSLVVAGNDGGVYVSNNGAASYTKSPNLPITQFYTCEMDYQFPERLYGGTQDNGTNRTTSGALDDWLRIYGGDGFYVLVDPVDNQYIYAESQRGGLVRSTNGGLSFLNARTGIDGNDRNNWNSPLEMDPNQSEILYFGTQRVYKSTNRAVSWLPISPDLSDGDPPGGLTFGTVTTIAAAASNGLTVYAGTDDGHVWVTQDGGTAWTDISSDLPDRWITRVATDPNDATIAYVTLSGYREDDPLPHVFRTENAGASWTNISGNLPEAPVNDIVVDPEQTSTLFVASDVGVFVKKGASDWEAAAAYLPNVPVLDLKIHPPTRQLLAGTFGRSMYTLDISIPCITPAEFAAALPNWGQTLGVAELVFMINTPCP